MHDLGLVILHNMDKHFNYMSNYLNEENFKLPNSPLSLNFHLGFQQLLLYKHRKNTAHRSKPISSLTSWGPGAAKVMLQVQHS